MLVCAVCTEYSLFWHELCNVNASQWVLTGGFFILLFHNNLDIFFYFLLLFLFSIFSVHDTDGFFSLFLYCHCCWLAACLEIIIEFIPWIKYILIDILNIFKTTFMLANVIIMTKIVLFNSLNFQCSEIISIENYSAASINK